MQVARRGRAGKSLLDIVVGLEAGTPGGIAMLVFFALITPLVGQPWCLMPNLLGVCLYADRYALFVPGLATLSGAAWIIRTAGVVGSLYGLLTGGGRLFGLAVAGSWYLIYAPQPVVIGGVFVYGPVIGWHPWLLAHTRARLPH